MTDLDDLLTLPVEDDDDDGDERSSARGAPHRTETVSSTELIAMSSSEARLATALLMQAQALEGMRREQADLLKRIDGGPSRAALQRSLGQVEAALKQVARLQQKAREQIVRSRRRSTRLVVTLLVLTLGLAGAVGWLAWSMRHDLPASLESMESRLASAEAGRAHDIDRAVAEVVTGAMSGQAEALAALSARLDDEQQRLLGDLAELRDVQDATQSALVAERTNSTDLRQQVSTLAASKDDLDRRLAEVRQERNRQIGENARLVEQVMDADQRLAELTATVSGLRANQDARMQPSASAIIESPPPNADGLASRLTAALRASGAADVVALEAGAVTDGALTGLLLRQARPDGGSARVVAAERGVLVIANGHACLRLDPAREQGASADAVLDIELPALDAPAWSALGLVVSDDFVPLPAVTAALDGMLAGQGWRVTRLGSFDGEVLGDIELVAEDQDGVVQRTLKAASATLLPTGPELELRDGTVAIGGDERPFYRDVYLLPLPGADFGAWLVAIDGSGR